MTAEFKGKIALDIRDSEPDWGPYAAPTAPADAPNVMYLVWDDIGIATWDCFGGLVEMPAMSRIADKGVRLSQFHTTALCSPTRAALLTGRNATTVGMATIEEFTDGFPNCNGRIPRDTALLSEVLAEHGYNTYAVGKWHLTPLEESNLAATKRHWPLGRGFERFYGFMGGETDQWYPDLVYDNHPVTPPATPEQGYHLSKDLADKTIEFIRDSKAIAPDKPWFTYLCPGAGHAPHHVFEEWADRYAGTFDMGYEKYRDIVLANQKRLGIVPPDTELSPMNPYLDVTGPGGAAWPAQDTVRPWDSLDDEEKRLFSRMAEVFAGFLSYTDAQIGRVLDYLEESGQLDNTIIVVISDNGASGEGGPNGSVNEVKFFNGYIDTVAESLRFYDQLGGPQTYNHYPIGWAMAFNTPYKLFKRYASHEGGIADSAIISWPKGIDAHGAVRDQYINVCDVTPTVYDLLGIPEPSEVGGIAQKPLDGVSFKSALEDPNAVTDKRTQFYAMLGTRGIWHEGWFANTVHAASPAGWGHFDDDRWELFHIDSDRSQCRDLAAENPEKLAELQELWLSEAAKYNGLPLGDLNIFETFGRWRPLLVVGRTTFVYYPDNAEVGLGAAAELRGQSFSVLAEVTIDTADAEGVLFKQGAGHGGHVLFVQNGHLEYVYNFMGEDEQRVTARTPIPLGSHVFGVRYERTGTVEGSHTPVGQVSLYIDDSIVGQADGVRTHPGSFGLSGGGIKVGSNTGQAVSGAYSAPFAFTGGTIAKAVVDISGTPYLDAERELARAFARD
ncbi:MULTISPECIES: arylsulfatase [Mycobacteriaceae]|uniref:Arylsulfatase n=1 Tax=Mycolicibacterium neoaurum VKM Ac-1815D TaxID=700508 RepID=V5X9C0_MYCNE|nr:MULTISPECIES: arylsulfatase [Mycobacteriaceae]AHC24296.1 arylsulfatase [Mycolicibacterium neoaurum VKM Ac-1815D]AMO04905.1 arylsulfatase [Mycolicibacterium neoaurum]AXK76785.1 arylsulfatase [Mycolicibacterium neoaurum]KJQ52009.1 arylsulfatase [Mycolicibacterium neoaurum]KUM10204.1 arylsulfatase [Mycolicibacterium neoaurum]